MLFEDFNIVSSPADTKLFWDKRFQKRVDNAIIDLLAQEGETNPEYDPDTIYINGNTLHMFVRNDRTSTERTIGL